MNEVLNVIKNRYSCRSFDGKKVEENKVEELVLAALASPSGMNQQPWKIVVVENKQLIDEMSCFGMDELKKKEDQSTYNRMMERGGTLFYNAPLMIVIAIKEGKELDCGIVVENIALAASSLGLGNCICGMARLPLSHKEYHDCIIPEGYVFGTSLLVGYPTHINKPHDVDMNKVVYVK